MQLCDQALAEFRKAKKDRYFILNSLSTSVEPLIRAFEEEVEINLLFGGNAERYFQTLRNNINYRCSILGQHVLDMKKKFDNESESAFKQDAVNKNVQGEYETDESLQTFDVHHQHIYKCLLNNFYGPMYVLMQKYQESDNSIMERFMATRVYGLKRVEHRPSNPLDIEPVGDQGHREYLLTYYFMAEAGIVPRLEGPTKWKNYAIEKGYKGSTFYKMYYRVLSENNNDYAPPSTLEMKNVITRLRNYPDAQKIAIDKEKNDYPKEREKWKQKKREEAKKKENNRHSEGLPNIKK